MRIVAVLTLLALAGPAVADLPALRFEAADKGFTLAGRDATRQLLVTGTDATGRARDLTREVTYSAAPADIVKIDANGVVIPLKEGTATITAKSGAFSATTTVTVTDLVTDLPVNFENQVV